MTDVYDRLAKLSPEKRALLLSKLNQREADAGPSAPLGIQRRERGDGSIPVSFGQQRLWFLHQFEPNSAAYNIPMAMRLSGQLNVAALERGLNEIARRHEVLRTVYATVEDRPEPVLLPEPVIELPVVEVPSAAGAEQEAQAQALIRSELQRPFDLARGLVMRALLLRLAATEHILVLTTHHIAIDGWSMGVVNEELAALYAAYTTGQEAKLPELAIQYADFAAWQRETLRGENLDRLATYWREHLQGAPAVVTFPADHARPPAQTFRGTVRMHTLPPKLADDLRALSRREGATLFMTLLATFQALLHRYTGQADVVVGSPIANRTRAEVEGLIGFFVNTLALRTSFEGEPTFRELLQRVRATSLAAFAHQDLPFERLVEELQPSRDPSYNAIFQVVFALQNTPDQELQLPGMTLQGMDVDAGTAQLDLSLYIWETPEGLVCRLEYNTDLFEDATITRLLGHFETMLGGIVADPGRAVAALPMLTRAERRQMLIDWNETSAPIPTGCVHELFAAQVARTPDKVAVRHGNHALTFRELDQLSNQLAHHLRAHGVGPEALVGLCVERGTQMIVALLGILKAGGAYLPLDPALPRERLAFMLEDSRAALILTQRSLLERLPERQTPVVCFDSDWPVIAQLPYTPPTSGATPESLMYVIYTSGSTGKPKGVQVVHRGMVNLIASMRREPGMTERDAMLTMTTLSFDMAGPELYMPLLTGAEMVVIGREIAQDGNRLLETIATSGVTVVQATPATWRLLLEAGWQGDRRLTILCGGEPLTRDLARQLLERCGALWNMYGPTETTVWSTCCRITDDEPEGAMSVGRPMANTQIYLLDAQGQPVPVGVPGELYIGGAGLARGYLNRPELTAEKYVPNLFARFAPHRESDRLYCTGDLARYRPDGNLEFLGRIDHQVKVRGFRIELGEIESVLGQHPDVAATVVLAREDTPGDQRLVAYIVPEAGRTPENQALRTHLKGYLPDYMVPAAFVTMAALPLTSNGKVDRKALPAPERQRSGAGTPGETPRNAEEARIAAIWSAVLGVEGVGIDDNFFELGGESFKAIRAVRQIGAPASVMDLFKHPTVRRLAAHLGGDAPMRQQGLLHELTPPIAVGQRKLSIVCVPYAGGNAIAFQPLANALPAGHALYALQLPGHDFARGGEALVPLEEVARLAAEEIRRDLSGPIAIYGHCVGGALTTAITRRLEDAGVEVAGVFVGGHFPTPRMPGKFWEWHARLFSGDRFTSKRSVLEFLHTSGFFTDVLDPVEQDFIIRGFLHDAREADDYYTEVYAEPEKARLRAPIVCLIGAQDRASELYEERYHEWEHFSERVDLAVIEGGGHYFLKHQAADVARIIAETRAAQVRPESPNLRVVSQAAEAAPARQAAQAKPNLLTFFLVAFGQFISLIGTGLTGFAMGVWVYQRTGSVSAFALISVAALLPGILLAPIAGAIADRWDRRKLMIAADSVAAIGTVSLALLLRTDNLQIWHIYLIAGLGAIANAFQQPAYLAAITQLVPKRYYGRANGIVQLGGAAGTILAPLLGGVLVVALGLSGIVLIDFATFLVAVTITALVRFPNALFQKQEEPFLREVARGWQYIAKRHGLVMLIVFTVAVNYLYSIMEVLTTPLALSLGSPAVLGIVAAATGVGLLTGSLAMGIWGGLNRRTNGIIGAVGIFGLSTIVMGLRPSPVFLAVGLFGAGLSVALINAHWLSIVQTKVGLELQGRVMATNLMLVWSMMPLGFLTAGPLADKVFGPLLRPGGALAGSVGRVIGTGDGRGMALLLIVAGSLALLFAVAAYAYRPIRRLEDALPDAIPGAVLVSDKDAIQREADEMLRAA